jgi:hypothetical protein
VVTGAAMGVGAAVVGLAWLARNRALREAAVVAASGAATGAIGRWRRRGA